MISKCKLIHIFSLTEENIISFSCYNLNTNQIKDQVKDAVMIIQL